MQLLSFEILFFIRKMINFDISEYDFLQYFGNQKKIEEFFVKVLQDQDNIEENFQNLMNFLKEEQKFQNKKDLLLLLKLIMSIADDHQRSINFFQIIEKIINLFKTQIQQFFHNAEIFNIFKSNKRILLFLIKEKILIINNDILKIIKFEQNTSQQYLYYFLPEIKDSEDIILLDEEIQNQKINDFELFKKQRLLGENENYICELIRNDLIIEFSNYVEKTNYPLSSNIPPSQFETNLFLLNKNPTLIEYTAFFGSFKIFEYLIDHGTQITPSIWIYAIHCQSNDHIIQYLNEKKIEPESYLECCIESIKCHHHDETSYFQQYIDIDSSSINLFYKCIKHYNFVCMTQFNELLINIYKSKIHSFLFNTLIEFCRFDYISIVELILNKIEISLNLKIQTDIDDILKLKKNQSNFCSMMNNDISSIYLTVLNICLYQSQIIEYQNTKIQSLENKNKILLMNKSVIEKKYKNEIQKNRLILGKLKKINRHLYELQKKIDKLSVNKNNSCSDENGPITLTSTIILELIKNENINIHARKYSDSLKDICFMLYINSNITYKLLRKFIPLPHPDHLRKIYRYNMKIKKENLMNKNQIEFLLHELHNELSKDENEPIISVLGFDAATIDPRNQGSNGLFVFNAQPLKGNLKSKVVYAKTQTNGKANKDIMKTVDEIEKAGEKNKIFFRFIASDGDSATNQIHRDFQNYINTYDGKISDDFLDYIGKYSKPIPISDWLHLLKNLRTRIIDNNIILFNGSEIISIKEINDILHLDKIVTNARGRSTMRDDIAIKLINDESLSILGENGQNCALVLMLPFVLFTIAIQSENLSIDARKQLCLLSYDIIVNISKESEMLPNQKSKNAENVGYLLNMMKIRTLNTIIGVAYALKDYNDHIMTSRLGTHIIEFIFGRMRNGCRGFDSLDQCIYQLVKAEVTKETLEKFNKDDVPILGRSHSGGSCFCENWKIGIDEKINLNKIIDECQKLIHHKISYNGSNIEQLINFLSRESPINIPNLRGTISGSKIIARQINYK